MVRCSCPTALGTDLTHRHRPRPGEPSPSAGGTTARVPSHHHGTGERRQPGNRLSRNAQPSPVCANRRIERRRRPREPSSNRSSATTAPWFASSVSVCRSCGWPPSPASIGTGSWRGLHRQRHRHRRPSVVLSLAVVIRLSKRASSSNGGRALSAALAFGPGLRGLRGRLRGDAGRRRSRRRGGPPAKPVQGDARPRLDTPARWPRIRDHHAGRTTSTSGIANQMPSNMVPVVVAGLAARPRRGRSTALTCVRVHRFGTHRTSSLITGQEAEVAAPVTARPVAGRRPSLKPAVQVGHDAEHRADPGAPSPSAFRYTDRGRARGLGPAPRRPAPGIGTKRESVRGHRAGCEARGAASSAPQAPLGGRLHAVPAIGPGGHCR